MPLANCPECGNQVSINAAACPQCGEPFTKKKASVGSETRPAVIEQTGKKWKSLQLIGFLMMVFFVCILPLGVNGHEGLFAVGFLSALLGFFLCIFARAMAWWHHG